MAAVTSAVAVGAGMAYGANRQAAGLKKAAAAQGSAAQQTLNKQGELYDSAMESAQPFYSAGTNALAQLEAVNKGDYSGFQNSPDYQFSLTQGMQGLDRNAAARGALYSGGADADRMTFASGLASQNLGNYTSRLMSLANMGQNQSQYMGQLGQNYGNQFAQTMGIKGQADAARASATAGAQAGYGNALASAAGTYMGMGGGGSGFNFGSMFGGSGNNQTNMLAGSNRKSSFAGGKF